MPVYFVLQKLRAFTDRYIGVRYSLPLLSTFGEMADLTSMKKPTTKSVTSGMISLTISYVL